MLQVSERAKTLLKDTLLQEPKVSGSVFRLERMENKIAIGLGAATGTDILFEHDGMLVLAAPAEIAEELEDATIDCDDQPNGPHLVLTR